MVEHIKKYERIIQEHPIKFMKLFNWAYQYAKQIDHVYFTSEYLQVEFRDRYGRTFIDIEPMATFLEWADRYEK